MSSNTISIVTNNCILDNSFCFFKHYHNDKININIYVKTSNINVIKYLESYEKIISKKFLDVDLFSYYAIFIIDLNDDSNTKYLIISDLEIKFNLILLKKNNDL